MKIGIITSWEDLVLWEFLTKYDHEYVVYCDTLHTYYTDKPYDDVKDWIETGKKRCRQQWCETIIIPPLRELSDTDNDILPLFRALCGQAFNNSLIGKIWLLTPVTWSDSIQKIVSEISTHHTLTANQKKITGFQKPFSFWTKTVPLRTPLALWLSKRDYLSNKIVKFDLRYMKDTFVDTIIPCSYAFCAFDKTIERYFNSSKQKYRDLWACEDSFVSLIPPAKQTTYTITFHITWREDILEKKDLLWLLQRGKQNIITRTK